MNGFKTNGQSVVGRNHRLAAVRLQEQVSLYRMAKRLGVSKATVKRQEESTDVKLSTIYAWQEALNVPIEELIVEPSDAISSPLVERARLIKVAKTALLLLEQSQDDPVRVLAQRMVDLLVDAMPELTHVRAWPSRGSGRASTDCPKILTQQISVGALRWTDDPQHV